MIGVVVGLVLGVVLGAAVRGVASKYVSFSSTLGCWLLRGFEAEERKRFKEIGKERRKLLRQGVIWVL